MVSVKLVAISKPLVGDDPRRVVILAIKTATGKLHQRSFEHYLTEEYGEYNVRNWLKAATHFPVVLEYVTFVFLIEGISRVCSHQLVRHRIASYVQESQRYSESYLRKMVDAISRYLGLKRCEQNDYACCYRVIEEFLSRLDQIDSSILKHVIEEAFVIPPALGDGIAEYAREILRATMLYYRMLANGVRKEDARFIIPQAVKTRILMQVNLRELLHIACLRLDEKAQWEIRNVVKAMLEEVEKFIPEIYELVKDYCSLDR